MQKDPELVPPADQENILRAIAAAKSVTLLALLAQELDLSCVRLVH